MFAFGPVEGTSISLLEARHAEEFFNLVRKNYERLAVWCAWLDRTETPEATHDFLREKVDRFSAGNGFTAGIFCDDRLSGVVALEYIDHLNFSTEIGYWLDAEVEGQGVITSTCRALLHYIFQELKLNRVQIRCATENYRSRAIPERLGFREEGILRKCERLGDRFVDLVVYSMLREEFLMMSGE